MAKLTTYTNSGTKAADVNMPKDPSRTFTSSRGLQPRVGGASLRGETK